MNFCSRLTKHRPVYYRTEQEPNRVKPNSLTGFTSFGCFYANNHTKPNHVQPQFQSCFVLMHLTFHLRTCNNIAHYLAAWEKNNSQTCFWSRPLIWLLPTIEADLQPSFRPLDIKRKKHTIIIGEVFCPKSFQNHRCHHFFKISILCWICCQRLKFEIL